MDHTDQDIVLNRISLALTRNRAHVNSWLSAKTLEETKAEEEDSAVDLEQAFRHLPEDAGLGSGVRYTGDGDTEGGESGVGGRKLESGEKFLEVLLGRREAKAHMASRAGGVGGKPTAVRPVTSRKKPAHAERHDEEEEEEGGRAAAFGAKKVRIGPNTVAGELQSPGSVERPVQGVGSEGQELARQGDDALILPSVLQVADIEPTKKKRANTYLDELLSQKAKKAKKKKTSTYTQQS